VDEHGQRTLIYLAALQTIPGELYEAAELEGANLFQRIRHVTIPQTRLVLIMLHEQHDQHQPGLRDRDVPDPLEQVRASSSAASYSSPGGL